jgi:hypothetical protein
MRFVYALIFLAYATAIIWEGVLFGSCNWMSLACLSIATGMGVLFLRSWATLAAVGTSAVTLAIWAAEVGSGAWPHSDFTANGMAVVWSLFWIWCPITVHRLVRDHRNALHRSAAA